MKHVVVSLSGGMDSSTLLLRCLKEYDTVTALSFDYGQKHRVELERAQSLVDYINDTKIKVTGNLDQIRFIKISRYNS
jgi:7-cyano-7-deazaguanine synthase